MSVHRQTIIPSKDNHTIELPEEYYGKKTEVIIFEVEETKSSRPVPPAGKVVDPKDLLEFFGDAPEFPSIEEIRSKVWPSKW